MNDENHGVAVPGIPEAFNQEECESDREAIHEKWSTVAIYFIVGLAIVLIIHPPWGHEPIKKAVSEPDNSGCSIRINSPEVLRAQAADAGAPSTN